jgi:hypothetical protein
VLGVVERIDDVLSLGEVCRIGGEVELAAHDLVRPWRCRATGIL